LITLRCIKATIDYQQALPKYVDHGNYHRNNAKKLQYIDDYNDYSQNVQQTFNGSSHGNKSVDQP